MRLPHVSVIIPTYNAGPHVPQAVESVLVQTYHDIELIVADDGSTDDTRARLEPYCDRLTYIYQPHGERSRARNLGISRSTGEYVAFLDADDYWAPEKLERQVAFLDRRPDVDVVYCWMTMIGPHGERIGDFTNGEPREIWPRREAFSRLMKGEPLLTGPGSTLIVRRKALLKAGGFDESLRCIEDRDLVLRLVMRSDLGCVPEPLAFFRTYGASWPEKKAALGVQAAYSYVVEKALASAPADWHEPALEAEARARAHWQAALVDFATGQIDVGRARTQQAQESFPALFEPLRFLDSLIEFASGLRDTGAPVEEAARFIVLVLSSLPSSLSHLRSLRRRTLGRLFAGRLFRAHAQGNAREVRAAAWRAATNSPFMLLNKGIVKMLLTSAVPLRDW